jgi:8-hydroxy-5-deazaflavin:NADPH oxidoreductase
MKITILGTGMVGKAHAAKLSGLGHRVTIGTRDVEKTMHNTNKDMSGESSIADWLKEHDLVLLKAFGESIADADIVINCLNGHATLKVMPTLVEQLKGKTLIDVANPLEFPEGQPPYAFISNTGSLGEQVQAMLPDTKVVKAFNTITAALMVDPSLAADGNHNLFIAGNDESARREIARFAQDIYGWKNVIDLGDMVAARGTESLLLIWLRLWGVLQTPMFGFKIAK